MSDNDIFDPQNNKPIVIDIGHSRLKIGIAGSKNPLVIPTRIVSAQHTQPCAQTNEFSNLSFSGMDQILVDLLDAIGVSLKNRKIVFIYPSVPVVPERVYRLLYERLQITAGVFLPDAYGSVLTSWTSNKDRDKLITGLAVLVGYSKTTIVPVRDEIVDFDRMKEIHFGVYDMINYIDQLLQESKVYLPRIQKIEIIEELLEKKIFRTVPDIVVEKGKVDSEPTKYTKSYTFKNKITDKSINVNLSHVLYLAAEVLSMPSLLIKYDLHRFHTNLGTMAELVHEVIQSCDMSDRKVYYGNIVLAGGGTCITNFPQRLAKNIRDLLKNNTTLQKEVKVINYPHQYHAPWLGGSTYALNLLETDWITKERYEKFCSDDKKGKAVLCDRQTMSKEEKLFEKGLPTLIGDFVPKQSCKDEVLKLQTQPGMGKLSYIVKECTKWYNSFLQKPDSNLYNLTDDEIFAVGLYTFDIGVNGKQTDNFYYQLNKKLKDGNQQELSHYRGYLYYLQNGLSKFPDISKTVFRGVPHLDIFKKNYTKLRPIHWSSFASTTPNLTKAKEFAGKDGCVLCITITKGKSIADYSVFPTEDEILLSPSMSFVVTNALHKKDDGQHYVELTEQASTFIF